MQIKTRIGRFAIPCLAATFVFLPFHAQAQSKPASSATPIEWSIGAGVASDYVGKGISKSDGNPAISGTAEISRGDLYANVFASSADLSSGAHAEVVTQIGWRPKSGNYNFDFALVNRDLPGTRDGVQSNYTEYQADIARKLGRFAVRLRVNYTPDGFGATEQAWWVESQGSFAINPLTKASVAIAKRSANNGVDYVAWNAGVKRKLSDTVSVDLRYYDTDSHDLGDPYDGRIVAALVFAL